MKFDDMSNLELLLELSNRMIRSESQAVRDQVIEILVNGTKSAPKNKSEIKTKSPAAIDTSMEDAAVIMLHWFLDPIDVVERLNFRRLHRWLEGAEQTYAELRRCYARVPYERGVLEQHATTHVLVPFIAGVTLRQLHRKSWLHQLGRNRCSTDGFLDGFLGWVPYVRKSVLLAPPAAGWRLIRRGGQIGDHSNNTWSQQRLLLAPNEYVLNVYEAGYAYAAVQASLGEKLFEGAVCCTEVSDGQVVCVKPWTAGLGYITCDTLHNPGIATGIKPLS